MMTQIGKTERQEILENVAKTVEKRFYDPRFDSAAWRESRTARTASDCAGSGTMQCSIAAGQLQRRSGREAIERFRRRRHPARLAQLQRRSGRRGMTAPGCGRKTGSFYDRVLALLTFAQFTPFRRSSRCAKGPQACGKRVAQGVFHMAPFLSD